MRAPLVLRILLRLYPASFRRDYGDEMIRLFLERRQAARGAGAVVALWLATVGDTLVAAAQTQWDTLRQDLAYALRTFRRAPGFTATVLVVAALGIGANTAAFSLTDHVLLRPLPFVDPERLVALWQNQLDGGYSAFELSPSNYRDWKGATTSFEGMGAYWAVSANLIGEGQPQRLEGADITSDLLPLLGVQPAFGRSFSADDDRDGAPGTVLLSFGLWQTDFGGEPSVVGREITLDGERMTVVGVMPRSFAFPGRITQFWRPIRFNADAYEDRTNTYLRVVARLKPGVPISQARSELTVIADRLAKAYPKDNAGVGATVRPLREDQIGNSSRVLVLALLGAATCVLLIACLNLANLLLARTLLRRKELALRTALGAGRERLIRQLLTESVLLALGGGVLGVLQAMAVLPFLATLVPPGLAVAAEPTIDLRVLAVASGAIAFAVLVFGVVPARRACGNLDAESLREGARPAPGRAARASAARWSSPRSPSRSCSSSRRACSSARSVSCRSAIRASAPRASSRCARRCRSRSTERSRTARPSTTACSPGRGLCPACRTRPTSASCRWRWAAGSGRSSCPTALSPRLSCAPRACATSRPATSPPCAFPCAPAATSTRPTQAIAPSPPWSASPWRARYWPGEDAVGKKIDVAFFPRTIVGVVGDVRVRGLEQDSEPQVYVPYRQIPDGWMPFFAPKDLVVRSASAPGSLLPALRAIIAAGDPEEPVANVRLLEDIVDAQTAPRRVQLLVIGTFAGLAFLLAAIGIYGLLSFAVSNRSQEIGVRMALGATPGSILSMVVREGLWLAAVGAVLGLALAYVAGRALEALLAGVAPTDAPTLAGALVVALVMTLGGSIFPAWRAARVDPARVMRSD